MPSQYQHWFPQWRVKLTRIMQDNCSVPYQDYLTPGADPGYEHDKTMAVTSCVLGNMLEADKMGMQSATVLLGLTPTILGLVGSSTAETSVLSLRRPVLSLILSLGSPSINPLRSFEYWDPVRGILLRSSKERGRSQRQAGEAWDCKSIAISALGYALALAAVANVTELAYELESRTICAFEGPSMFTVYVWTYTAACIHILGAIALRTRLKDQANISVLESTGFRQKANHIVRTELTPCGAQVALDIVWKPIALPHAILSWCTSTFTVLHIVFGTLVCTSRLFISTQDALAVVARYLASALACRILVVCELSGLTTTPEALDGTGKLAQQHLKDAKMVGVPVAASRQRSQ
ncbi:hypothetical protein F5883DRAFT_548066 [Diaporthe sp. PMI_573]|nr:hypothetical protein F5883DRAFT_548066 [Diaporthaceae sp. PMI_573]